MYEENYNTMVKTGSSDFELGMNILTTIATIITTKIKLSSRLQQPMNSNQFTEKNRPVHK